MLGAVLVFNACGFSSQSRGGRGRVLGKGEDIPGDTGDKVKVVGKGATEGVGGAGK